MKILTRTTTFAVALGLLTVGTAFGATTATSNVSADIVPAVSISNTAGLVFGQIAPSPAAGTVSVDALGARTSTGGVTLGNAVTSAAASFTVTGAAGATFGITIPSAPVTLNSGANVMTVTGFTRNPSGTLTLTGGTQVVTVGGTLNVAINQIVGSYTGTFDVSVAYN